LKKKGFIPIFLGAILFSAALHGCEDPVGTSSPLPTTVSAESLTGALTTAGGPVLLKADSGELINKEIYLNNVEIDFPASGLRAAADAGWCDGAVIELRGGVRADMESQYLVLHADALRIDPNGDWMALDASVAREGAKMAGEYIEYCGESERLVIKKARFVLNPNSNSTKAP